MFTLALLPSLLVTSLVLSACNDTTSTSSSQAKSAASNTSEIVSATEVEATLATNHITTEQQMIDNLTRYRWTLATAVDNSTQPVTELMDIKDQVILSFSQHQGQDAISYSVGCNMMSAAYQLQGSTLTLKDSMSTKMSCDDLNEAENRLSQLMQGSSQLSMADGETPLLTQITDDEITLVWNGKMTARAKYNSKGETIFWAVNAKTKPCTTSSAQMCLQVKPITYNDQGIKTDEGKWTEFTGSIDGYQHDSEEDQVLRLQRYALNDDSGSEVAANADAQYAYVLDTVIERTIVN